MNFKRILSLTSSSVNAEVNSGESMFKITLINTNTNARIKLFFSGAIYSKVLLERVDNGIFLSPFNTSNSLSITYNSLSSFCK